MATLTPEQRLAVDEAGSSPVHIEDPVTRELFVILKADVYKNLLKKQELEKIDPSFYEYGGFTPRPS